MITSPFVQPPKPPYMRKRYAMLFVPLMTTGLCAQPYTLTHNEQLPPGSEYHLRAVQNISAVDTTGGQDRTWQHGSLLPTGAVLDVAVLVPGASPYTSSFPTANYCLYESVVARYSYFMNTPDSMSRIGFWRSGIGTYSDPQTELVYPVTFGDTNTDTWANNTVSFPGTHEYTVIGTGSLVLPSGTWNDVLLLRIRSVNVFTFTQYAWVSAANGAYLLIYSPASLFGAASAQMITSLTVGIDDADQPLDLRLHAPGHGQLPLTYTAAAPLSYRIMDSVGRLLTAGTTSASAQPRTEVLDITMVRSGVHLIELTSGEQRRTLRFFVE